MLPASNAKEQREDSVTSAVNSCRARRRKETISSAAIRSRQAWQ
jgi:hypothetical protein